MKNHEYLDKKMLLESGVEKNFCEAWKVSEQEIVKPYLDKLKEQICNLDLYGEDGLVSQFDVFELIDNI